MDDLIDVRLTLVSASPRRAELLGQAGLPFDICPSQAAEHWSAQDVGALAIENARRKVMRSPLYGDRSRILLGADTVIRHDRQLFGKPAGPESASRMLQRLSGQSHDVITGVFASGPGLDVRLSLTEAHAFAVSRVWFRTLSADALREYLASGEWQDKAGAYAIQGLARNFVTGLEGDLDNVIGLPLKVIDDLLRKDFLHCRFR